MKISAAIIARNEEKNLPYCLQSLHWVDEIVVVDMGSQDKTKEIALGYTKNVYSHPVVKAFDIAKKYAVEHTTGEWVLLIDADEMVPQALAESLHSIAVSDKVDIVDICFYHYLLGKKILYSGWKSTPMPRFFKRNCIHFSEVVHDYMRPDPASRRMLLPYKEELCLQHFCYRDSEHFITKMNRYTSLEAENLFRKGVRFSFSQLIIAPVREFIARFFRGKGYRDGLTGLALCLMMAFYRLLLRIKLLELWRNDGRIPDDPYENIRKSFLSSRTGSEPASKIYSDTLRGAISACIVCGSSTSSPYLDIKEFHLVKCIDCGLVYAKNFFERPSVVYDESYFQTQNKYTAEAGQFERGFELLFDKISLFKSAGNILDIGTGVGSLLVVARRRGFNPTGVEMSNWASAYARDRFQLPVKTGILEQANFASESFDVVVLNHSLEHIPDPVAILREARRILRNDGLLVIGVPNVASIMAFIKREHWASWHPGEHIWFFSPRSLRKLLKQTGFSIRHFEARDNYPASGLHPVQLIRRAINWVATKTDTSEAMLFFATKDSTPMP
ncbi:MAG: methyltransferase domain-containing protein [Candidatus Riflebacteria bacterium]|nr:methyltransferase domain-containing protein [Candidatus Riflebacteria bacterium]